MVKLAWEEPRSKVDDILEQIFKLSRIICSFPLNKNFELSFWKCVIPIVLILIPSFSSILVAISLQYGGDSIYLVFAIISLLVIYATSWANSVFLFLKKRQFQLIRKHLKEAEACLRKEGVQWSYDVKWFKMNANFFLGCLWGTPFAIYHTINFDFINYFWFKIHMIFFFAVLFQYICSVINQLCGLLSLVRSLISQIRYVSDTSAQVRLIEVLSTVTELVFDCYEIQLLLFITGTWLLGIVGIRDIIDKGVQVLPFYVYFIIPLMSIIQVLTATTRSIMQVNSDKSDTPFLRIIKAAVISKSAILVFSFILLRYSHKSIIFVLMIIIYFTSDILNY